jgi:pimeloyl-ACP methyl ester carboxylesterase
MPLLLLYAREDPMVPPSVGPKLAALIPDAELVWMDETSHFAHVDSPDRVAPLLHDFLGARRTSEE